MNQFFSRHKLFASPSIRFYVELGICILFAFVFLQLFEALDRKEDGQQELNEVAWSLDDLKALYSKDYTYQPKELHLISEISMVKVAIELIAFHEIWLDGLEDSRELPREELDELRERMKLMKEDARVQLESLEKNQLIMQQGDRGMEFQYPAVYTNGNKAASLYLQLENQWLEGLGE
ncbi:MAG: hypothetical protein MRZ79_10715 [Bacteroidia bacterium]|nr:hypothetical protein [Bacteroidia bacterium]